jgi:hypothetical protein
MWRSWLVIEKTPQTEAGTSPSFDWCHQYHALDRRVAPVGQCSIDDFTLAPYACQLIFVRRHVTLVLDGQSLFPVVVRSDLERNIASRVDANRDFSGWRVKRNSYGGCPAITLLCNEDSAVTEFDNRAWRFRRADIDDRNAARSRCMIRHRAGASRDSQKKYTE